MIEQVRIAKMKIKDSCFRRQDLKLGQYKKTREDIKIITTLVLLPTIADNF